MTGRIEHVDPIRPMVRIGPRDLWVSSDVDLARLIPGARVVVSGDHDPVMERGVVDRILWPGSRSRSEPQGRPIKPEVRDLIDFLGALLVEVRSEVWIVECDLLPSSDQYAVVLRIPGEIGKELLLPRRTLDRAFVDPNALRRVRNMIRAGIEILRSHRAINVAREAHYGMTLDASPWLGPRCARCGTALFADEPALAQDGIQRHMACPFSG